MLLKLVFMIHLGIFEVGSLLCGVARSSKMLIVGRAVAGMGGAGITNGALTIIALCVPMQKRPSMSDPRPVYQSSWLMSAALKNT
jgi:MFS family permease